MAILKTHQHKRLLAFVISIVFSTIIAGLCSLSTGLQEIENRTWDWRVKMTVKKGSADSRIALIEVDQSSLENQAAEGFTWPWPRSRYVPIIKFLEAAGARGLAFDLFFSEPSVYGSADDQSFAEALGGKLPVLNIVGLSKNTREINEDAFEILARRLDEEEHKSHYSRLLADKPEVAFESVLMPIPQILEKSHGFGNAAAEPDSDGVLRHYAVGGFIRDLPILNSPFAFFKLIEKGAYLDLTRFLDEQGRLTVRFHEAEGAYSPISAHAVIESYQQLQKNEAPLIDPAKFRDKWIYLGVTAPGLFDLKPTPLNERAKGVEYLTTVLDNILNNNFIIRSKAVHDLALATIFAFWICAAVFFVRAPYKQLNLIFVTLAFLAIAYLSARYGYWIGMVTIAGSILSSLISSLALQYWLEGSQHRFIREAFRFYVSPSVIEQIISNPDKLSLGGEKRELSIFFSDIAGFTTLSERLEASQLVQLMNKFLTEMTNIIQASDGTVDKYVGDAIVAFWNAPIDQPSHALMAVKTAMLCQQRLESLQVDFKEQFGVEIKMRVGVNTGLVSVGNFGSQNRFSYTMIGDAANFASRLEGSNKYFGTSILIGSMTQKAIEGSIHTRKIAKLQVVGKSEAIEVFEPLFDSSQSITSEIASFNQAVKDFEAGELEKALERFKAIPQDPVARVYISRLERDIRKGKDELWSPVWKLSEK